MNGTNIRWETYNLDGGERKLAHRTESAFWFIGFLFDFYMDYYIINLLE